MLPSSATRVPTPPPPSVANDRVHERSLKRFELVTKEVDRGVISAYMALAEGDEELLSTKSEWGKKPVLPAEAAVDRYLDDSEWEQVERRSGRGPHIQGFPYFTSKKQ